MAKQQFKIMLQVTHVEADGVSFCTKLEHLTNWEVPSYWLNPEKGDTLNWLSYGRKIIATYKDKLCLFRVVGITATEILVITL